MIGTSERRGANMQKTKKRPGHIKRQLKRYSVLYVILLLAIVY